MARFDTSGMQYFDDEGNILTGGKLYFYDVTTGDPKTTYADSQQQIENEHPVVLGADGRPPSIFFSGTARLDVRTRLGALIESKEPVGQASSSTMVVTTLSPTRHGEGVTAPDARLLETATGLYNFVNPTGYYATFSNNEGDIEFFIPPFGSVVVSLSDNTTQAGIWSATGSVPVGIAAEFSMTIGTAITGNYRVRVVALDSDRDAIIFWGAGAAYIVGYNRTTGERGEPKLLRTTVAGTHFCQAILTSPSSVLACFSINGSADIDARVVTFVGVEATPNSTVTKTMAGTMSSIGSVDPDDGRGIIAQTASDGSTVWLLPYVLGAGTPGVLHISISGTTPTISTEYTLTGATDVPAVFSIGTGIAMAVTITAATSIRLRPMAVTASAVTLGTEATITTAATNLIETCLQQSGVYVYIAHRLASGIIHNLATCSATTVTSSSATVATGAGTPANIAMHLVGNQAIISGTTGANTAHVNVMTNNSGTTSAGVVANISYSNLFACVGYSDTELYMAATDGSGKYRIWAYGILGANPVEKISTTAAGVNGVTLDSLQTTAMAALKKIYDPKFGIGRKNNGRLVSAGASSRFLSFTGRTAVKLEALPDSADCYIKQNANDVWGVTALTQGGTGWVVRKALVA